MAVIVTSLGLCLALLVTLRNAWPHLFLSYEQYQARQASATGGE
jgi:hypothetical protein